MSMSNVQCQCHNVNVQLKLQVCNTFNTEIERNIMHSSDNQELWAAAVQPYYWFCSLHCQILTL